MTSPIRAYQSSYVPPTPAQRASYQKVSFRDEIVQFPIEQYRAGSPSPVEPRQQQQTSPAKNTHCRSPSPI